MGGDVRQVLLDLLNLVDAEAGFVGLIIHFEVFDVLKVGVLSPADRLIAFLLFARRLRLLFGGSFDQIYSFLALSIPLGVRPAHVVFARRGKLRVLLEALTVRHSFLSTLFSLLAGDLGVNQIVAGLGHPIHCFRRIILIFGW